jgi:hypothetical protein
MEKAACEAIRFAVDNFLGRHKASNYRQFVEELPESYRTMGCNVTENTLPSFSLGFLPTNLRDVSDEHDERLYQDISNTEKRYLRKWNPTMLGDYYWQLKRKAPDTHKTKSSGQRF